MLKTSYSKSQVTKAGKILVEFENCRNICDDELNNAFNILSYWRTSHINPLDLAFDKIQSEVVKIDNNAIFAKRLKRLESIKNKIIRQKNMALWRMYDIGGCRVIVNSPKKLQKVLNELKKWPEFKKIDWSLNIKDYILFPKDDWYRSVHLIWKFPGNNGEVRNIEVQIRTTIQHGWATALEIVDIFTKQNLKSNQWDQKWKDFFLSVSKEFEEMEKIHLFSYKVPERVFQYYDGIKSNNTRLSNHRTTKKFISKLDIINKFAAFTASVEIANNVIDKEKYDWYMLLEIDLKKWKLYTDYFMKSDNGIAEIKYTEVEKQFATDKNKIIALVSCSTIWGIKEAYPNYFADSTDFINYLMLIDTSPIRKTFFWL